MFAFKIILLFTVLGSISSGIGGVISSFVKNKSNIMLASLYEITSGIMLGIVFFDMIPESFLLAPKIYTILGIAAGVYSIYLVDYFIRKSGENSKIVKEKFPFKLQKKIKYSSSSLLLIISMSIHNAIEGLAIGTGFSTSYSLGLSILISMFLHDIPEGIVIGAINVKDKKDKKSVILNSALVGSSVGIGCLLGLILGNIADKYIALGLSIAAGAMLYIVVFELQIDSKKLTDNKIAQLMYIIGIVLVGIINL